MIDLCTLGTGGTMPLHTRPLASLYVRCGKRALLVDCGEGTQVEIGRLGWGFQRLEALLISHFHADHCSGLPGLLLALTKARWCSTSSPAPGSISRRRGCRSRPSP